MSLFNRGQLSNEKIYQEGFEAYLAGDLATAAACFENAANAGHAEAMFRLADMYSAGIYYDVDQTVSCEYLLQAAEAGSLYGQVGLAVSYANGIPGVLKKDRLVAEEWLAKALEQGCDYAVGTALKYGLCGYTADIFQAADHFRQMFIAERDFDAADALLQCLLEIEFEKGSSSELTKEIMAICSVLEFRQSALLYMCYASMLGRDGGEVSDKELEYWNFAIEKKLPGAISGLAARYMVSGDMEKARVLFNEAAARENCAEGIIGAAVCDFAEGQSQEESPQDFRIRQRNYIEQLEHAEALGSTEASMYLGMQLEQIDPERAAQSYLKAALDKNGTGFLQLGKLYQKGFGVQTANSQLAVSFFREAVNKNESAGHVEMGLAYGQGKGVEQDMAAALGHFFLAAKAGDPQGMFHYGNMLRLGVAGFLDEEEGKLWIARAAELKNPEAMYVHCICNAKNGLSRPQEEIIEEAAELGFAEAQLDCGIKYLQDKKNSESLGRAFDYFAAAAAQGNAEANYWVGMLLQDKDPAAAEAHLRSAADLGDSSAQCEMGLDLLAKKDYIHAYPYLEAASRQGVWEATNALADIYKNGLGVPQDREQSDFFYGVAEKQQQMEKEKN